MAAEATNNKPITANTAPVIGIHGAYVQRQVQDICGRRLQTERAGWNGRLAALEGEVIHFFG
jgi:hypothetical protein